MNDSMLWRTVLVGLAAGYLTYLATVSTAAPKWWGRFVTWWSSKTPWGGKPFACMFCMSFWLSLVLMLPFVVYRVYTDLAYLGAPMICDFCPPHLATLDLTSAIGQEVVMVFAASAISYIYGHTVDRLSTTFL